MRRNSILRFSVAFFLLLIFFQQMGAGLFVHNLLHEGRKKEHVSSNATESKKGIRFACSCVDDFLMPFMAAEEFTFSAKCSSYISFNEYANEAAPASNPSHASLRGPPSFLASS
jgi:hypothetical protein